MDKLTRMIKIPHQRRTGMAIHNLFHRAAHVNVNDRGATVFIELGSLRHLLAFATGELNRHRKFFSAVGRHFHAALGRADHGLRRDHFRHDKARAILFYEAPKRHIRHPRHGCENNWIFDFYRSNVKSHQSLPSFTRHCLNIGHSLCQKS